MAKKAGKELLKLYADFDRSRISFKGTHEIVTRADQISENMILSAIRKKFPTHHILSEESGMDAREKSEYLWIVDPLDGTTNFSFHNPFFAVSIALVYKSRIILGAVYAPFMDELYVASGKNPSTLNGKKIHVSSQNKLNTSILTYCHGSDRKSIGHAISIYKKVKTDHFDIRQLGAASLECAYVACGRTEAIVIPGARAWDVAAGTLIVRNSGGRVTDFANHAWNIRSKDFLASNKKTHSKILKII